MWGGDQTLCVKGLTVSGAHRAEAGTVLPCMCFRVTFNHLSGGHREPELCGWEDV